MAMSTVFCAFRWFNKRSVNIEEKQAAAHKPYRQHQSGFFGSCRTFFSQQSLKLRNASKYSVKKTSKTSSDANGNSYSAQTERETIGKSSQNTNQRVASPNDDKLSKINHLSIEAELSEKKPPPLHSVNGEEASLTQIVIAQIEHDNNERNRKAIELSRDSDVSNSLDRHQNDKLNEATVSGRHIDATAKNKEQQEIKGKLSVPLGFDTEQDNLANESLYDVPRSLSMNQISLGTSGEQEQISLQKQHHIQISNHHGYFHTSSPVLNVDDTDNIYDTPSTRSMAI